MPKLTAAIVTYNSSPEDVIRAANSFAAAELDSHLVIFDNASPNQTLEKLRGQCKAEYIQHDLNLGFGAGHNRALQHCPESDYHLILNPDVEIHPGTLEALIAYMGKHSEVGVVSPSILNENGTTQYLNKLPPTVFDLFARRFLPGFLQKTDIIAKRMYYFTMRDKGYDHPIQVPYMTGCFMLFRRSVFEQIGGFDERYFMYMEDADISMKVNQCSRAMYVPAGTITHRWARGSHKSWRLTWENIRAAWKYFNKWGWRWW